MKQNDRSLKRLYYNTYKRELKILPSIPLLSDTLLSNVINNSIPLLSNIYIYINPHSHGKNN
jgi:hypothetical protein